jgi:hypothetical protein
MVQRFTLLLLVLASFTVRGQEKSSSENDYKTKGISVSPAHFHLAMEPGESKTYEITVKNDTEKAQKFRVNKYDFNMNGKGKTGFLPSGTGKYSLSKWLNLSPTFIEVAPGEKKQVNFTVTIPTDGSGERSAWSVIMVEQEEPRNRLEPAQKSEGTVALGVIPTFAFGVFVYQNPPNVANNQVEITNFKFIEKDSMNIMSIEATNTGNGIAYCTSYIDLTHLDSGKQQRLSVKRFTIVPELIRDFNYTLPKALPKGKYVAVGVLDYEGSEEIQAAKTQFEIK